MIINREGQSKLSYPVDFPLPQGQTFLLLRPASSNDKWEEPYEGIVVALVIPDETAGGWEGYVPGNKVKFSASSWINFEQRATHLALVKID